LGLGLGGVGVKQYTIQIKRTVNFYVEITVNHQNDQTIITKVAKIKP